MWPALLLNCCVFAVMAADHLTAALAQRAAAEAAAKGSSPQERAGSGSLSFFLPPLLPPLSAPLAQSIQPTFRFSLFAIALLQAHRISRACGRWGDGRASFGTFNWLATVITQRAEASLGGGYGGRRSGSSSREQHLLAEGIARWAVVWQFIVLQLVTRSSRLHPAARKLLKPRELAVYDRLPPGKGWQLASQRLTHLMVLAPELAYSTSSSAAAAAFSSSSSGAGSAARGAGGAAAMGGGEDAFRASCGGGMGGGGASVHEYEVSHDLLSKGVVASATCSTIKSQCLPAAVALICTGVTEAFLLLIPLSALRVGKGVGGGGGEAGVGGFGFGGGGFGSGSNATAVAAVATGSRDGAVITYDDNVASVAFTLGIWFVLYLFVCLLMFALVELAAALEDPFAGEGHIPVEDLARATLRDVARTRREAAEVLGLGIGGDGWEEEGGRKGEGRGCNGHGGKGGDENDDDEDGKHGGAEQQVFMTVDWEGAEALCAPLS